MDPKSKLYNKPIHITKITKVLSEWILKGKSYYWSRSIDDVKRDLILASREGYILFGEAVKILRTAETSKMPSTANAGQRWIIEQWKNDD